MKHYRPLAMKPDLRQFYEQADDSFLATTKELPAYQVVHSLFATSEKLYRNLNHLTSEQLSVFVDAGKYLTRAQEHDLVALVTSLVSQLDIDLAVKLVEQEERLSTSERARLLSIVEIFKSTVQATTAALGHPQWIE
jgi:hypothetical protein